MTTVVSNARERGSVMTGPVVYRALDLFGALLYVGCTIDFAARVREHERHSPWWPFHVDISVTRYSDRKAALDAESIAIATEYPRWNVKGRSPEHPDGPMRSYNADHLRHELEIWRKWKRASAEKARSERVLDRMADEILAIALLHDERKKAA